MIKNGIATMIMVIGWVLTTPAGVSLAASVTPDKQTAKQQETEDDEFEGLPAGPGQEETFYVCQSCHSIKLVLQQGLSRERWQETLEYMVEEQEMEPLEPESHKQILDYLSAYLGEDRKNRLR